MCFVLFLTFELLFFNSTRNINYGTKFHFAGICLFKFILYLKFEKRTRFFRVFLTFKLKVTIFEVYGT